MVGLGPRLLSPFSNHHPYDSGVVQVLPKSPVPLLVFALLGGVQRACVLSERMELDGLV